MATTSPLSLSFIFLLTLLFAATPTPSVVAQVPANETFRFVNNGEFGDYIMDYGASYRIISITYQYDFYAFPFRLCFFNTTPDAFVFAVRAGLPRDEDLMRWIWDANRNDPVRENATLSFGIEGNLVLADVDGRVVWQTNTANKGVTGMKMLGNGNLVLHDKNGKFIWQSFDHPTDTLLIGQRLSVNGQKRLVSRTSDADGSDGKYSMVIDRKKGLTMYMNYSSELLIYGGWPGHQNYTGVYFDAQPENPNATAYELVLNFEQEQTLHPSGGGRRRLLQSRPIGGGNQVILFKLNYNATLSFLRLGSDGSLKAYTYYPLVDYLRWAETYSFFSDYYSVRECALPTKCGSFGYCDKAMCTGCPSPKGVLGWTESCAPPELAPCSRSSSSAKVKYYKVGSVEHFLSPYIEGSKMKLQACMDKCSKDCKWLGFIYKKDKSRCLLLAPVLATLIKAENTSMGYIKY